MEQEYFFWFVTTRRIVSLFLQRPRSSYFYISTDEDPGFTIKRFEILHYVLFQQAKTNI